MRRYDPVDQRTTADVQRLVLYPASEVLLDQQVVRSFRAADEAAANAILIGEPERPRRARGLEHGLPRFHERLETLFDYLPEAVLSLDPEVEERVVDWLGQVADAHETRRRPARNGGRPVRRWRRWSRGICIWTKRSGSERVAERPLVAFTAPRTAGMGAPRSRASTTPRILAWSSRDYRAGQGQEAGDRIVLAAPVPAAAAAARAPRRAAGPGRSRRAGALDRRSPTWRRDRRERPISSLRSGFAV